MQAGGQRFDPVCLHQPFLRAFRKSAFKKGAGSRKISGAFLFFKNLETKQVKRSIRERRIDEVRKDGLKRVVIAKHTQEFSSSSLNRIS